MKCITHDNVDAVSTCASCGAGICKACEENSGFRIENKALCSRCNNRNRQFPRQEERSC